MANNFEKKDFKNETRERIADITSEGRDVIVPVYEGHIVSVEEDESISWPGLYFYNTKTKQICWTPSIHHGALDGGERNIQHPTEGEGIKIELTDEELKLEKELTKQFEGNEWKTFEDLGAK